MQDLTLIKLTATASVLSSAQAWAAASPFRTNCSPSWKGIMYPDSVHSSSQRPSGTSVPDKYPSNTVSADPTIVPLQPVPPRQCPLPTHS